MVVSQHSSVFHDIINQPHIYETFTVTFIETPSFHTVDTCEEKLFDKRDTHIKYYPKRDSSSCETLVLLFAMFIDFLIQVCQLVLTFSNTHVATNVENSL